MLDLEVPQLQQRRDGVHRVRRRHLQLGVDLSEERLVLKVHQPELVRVLREPALEPGLGVAAHQREHLLRLLDRQPQQRHQRVQRLPPGCAPHGHARRHVARVEHRVVQVPVPVQHELELADRLQPLVAALAASSPSPARGGERGWELCGDGVVAADLGGEVLELQVVPGVVDAAVHELVGHPEDGEPQQGAGVALQLEGELEEHLGAGDAVVGVGGEQGEVGGGGGGREGGGRRGERRSVDGDGTKIGSGG